MADCSGCDHCWRDMEHSYCSVRSDEILDDADYSKSTCPYFSGELTDDADISAKKDKQKMSTSTVIRNLILAIVFVGIVALVIFIFKGNFADGGLKKLFSKEEKNTVQSYDEVTDSPEYVTDEYSSASVNETTTVKPEFNYSAEVIPIEGLYLRSEPTTSSEPQHLMRKYEKVVVFEFEGDWAHVRYNDLVGWCHRDYIFVDMEVQYPPSYDKGTVEHAVPVKGRIVDMFNSPDSTREQIFAIEDTETVDVLAYKGSWVFIRYDGHYAWCDKNDLVIEMDVPIVPEEGQYDGAFTTVLPAAGLNLRETPDVNGRIIVVMKQGANVELIRTEGEWSYVKFGDVKGWCASEYLQEIR